MLVTDLSAVFGKYAVVYADPPWDYYGDPNKDQAAGKHYDLMGFNEIAAIPVRSIMSDHSVLFLWATSPKLDVAIDVIRAWGLHFRGIAYVWVKTTNDGKIISGQGVRPSIVKPTTEYVIAASPVSKGRPLPVLTESQGQVVLAPRPDGIHSRKPPVVRTRIEELYGAVPRIELFAREQVNEWDAWGKEAGGASEAGS